MLSEYKDQKQISSAQNIDVCVGCRSAFMFNDKLFNFAFVMKVEPVELVCSSVYVDLCFLSTCLDGSLKLTDAS